MKISTFTFRGVDIDLMFQKRKLAYTLEIDGKRYGNAVDVKSRKTEDLVNATFLLLTNAVDTLDDLKK